MGDNDHKTPPYDSPPRFSTKRGNVGNISMQELGEESDIPSHRTSGASINEWTGTQGSLVRKPSASWQELIAQLPSSNVEVQTILEIASETNRRVPARIIEEIEQENELERIASGGRLGRHKSLAYAKSRKSMRRKGSTQKNRKSMFFGVPGLSNEDSEAIEESKIVIDNIKEKSLRMSIKREIIREEKSMIDQHKRRLGRFQLWWAETSLMIMMWYHHVLDEIRDLHLWKKSIKLLEGKHGAAVGTFFTFLRWCLFLNIIISVLFASFVMIPYGIEHGRGESHDDLLVPAPETSDFSATEEMIGLFTGGASLNRTAYFMGSYMLSYEKYSPPAITNYDIGLAYLLVTGMYLFLSFVAVFLSVRTAVHQSVKFAEEGQHDIAEIVFAGYDHSLTESKSIDLKQVGLAQLLREILGEHASREEYDKKDRNTLYAKRFAVNFTIFTILALALWAIQVAVTEFSQSDDDILRLVPPILLATFNLVLPIAFEILAKFEEWRTHLFVIQVSVVRSVILRIVGLYVFFYTAFNNRNQFMCWETYVGQQVYNVFIIVFIFEIVTSIIVDPVKLWAYERWDWTHNVMATARFQTIKNTLEMIYSQALIWFGSFFCPMLAIIGVFKLCLLFYLKKWSTIKFCQPPKRSFKARHSLRGLIYLVMLVTMLTVAIPLGYTIVQLPSSGAFMPLEDQARWINSADIAVGAGTCDTNTVTCQSCLDDNRDDTITYCWKPEDGIDGVNTNLALLCTQCMSGCGPFRNQESFYDTLIQEFNSWPEGLQIVMNYMGTLAFAVVILFVIGSWLLIMIARNDARKKRIKRLIIERDMERMDKIWILNKYHITLDDNNNN